MFLASILLFLSFFSFMKFIWDAKFFEYQTKKLQPRQEYSVVLLQQILFVFYVKMFRFQGIAKISFIIIIALNGMEMPFSM